MILKVFRCPYCGGEVYYYGDTLAICSSGVRLHPSDIPPTLFYTRNQIVDRPVSMLSINSQLRIGEPPNPIQTNQAFLQRLIKR